MEGACFKMWLQLEHRAHYVCKPAEHMPDRGRLIFKVWLSPQRRAHPPQQFEGTSRTEGGSSSNMWPSHWHRAQLCYNATAASNILMVDVPGIAFWQDSALQDVTVTFTRGAEGPRTAFWCDPGSSGIVDSRRSVTGVVCWHD
eukprot:3946767-Pyramimonas_sp.AAC.1